MAMHMNLNKTSINSIITAIMLSANAITWLLPFHNILAYISLFCMFLYLLVGNSIQQFKVLPIIFLFLFFFILTFIKADRTETATRYFFDFIVIGITSLYISQSHIDIKKVLTYTVFISLFVIPKILRINVTYNELLSGQLMGYSYGLLPFLITDIIVLFHPGLAKNNWIKSVASISLIIGLYSFSLFASRGAVLSLIVFIVLLIILRSNSKKNTRILLFLIILGVVLLTFNFNLLISTISSLTDNLGIEFAAVNKLARLSESGTLDNGRIDLIESALKLIATSPFFGHYIGVFEETYGIGYVHNFLLQLLLEGGLILAIPIVFIIYKSLQFIFNDTHNKEKKIYISYLFVTAIVCLLFSNYFWRHQYFWLLIGYTLREWNTKINP